MELETELKKLNEIIALIKDEEEAIHGYEKVIKMNLYSDEIIAKLNEIKKDEEEHKLELTNILFRI